MGILKAIGAVFRWFAGALVPMFVPPVPPIGLAWFVHVLLVAGITVLCYVLTFVLELKEQLGNAPHDLKPYWLAILFLLVYAVLWAVAQLRAMLASNRPTTDFPDLDAAWDEVLTALDKAGIGINDTPLFLVFGQLPEGFDALFRALPHGLMVAGGTGHTSALRVYANREGIYVTLLGASLLGAQEQGGLGGAGSAFGNSGGAGGSVYYQSIRADRSIGLGGSVGASMAGASVGASVGAGGPLQQIQKIIRQANREGRDLTDAEKQRIRELSGGGPAGDSGMALPPDPSSGPIRSILQYPDLVDEADARLTHVCMLIASTRWPYCPINGAILAIPMAAAERDESAQQWGLVARQDLGVAESALKLRFPVYALAGGTEDLSGGQMFFERFAADKGNQRLGKSFPLNPDVTPERVGEHIERGISWVFGGLLPYWAFKMMRAEATTDTTSNASIVRFMAEVRHRGPNLARLVSRAVMVYGDQTPVFAGCYLVVFPHANREEAKFAREFFKKVETSQGAVAWTDEALVEDAGYRSKTVTGHITLALLALAVVAFAVFVAFNKSLFGK